MELILVLIASLIVLIAALLARFLSNPSSRSSYRKTDELLSPAERSFFGVLRQAVDSDLYIFAKVRLADLLWLPKDTKGRQAQLNRILSKHIDFVLCDASTTSPRLLVELDDSSHRKASRERRDAFVDEAVRAASLPILRVPAKRSYAPEQLRQLISPLLLEGPPAAEPPST